ncbi:carbohydrate ABC transporter permease [Propionibacteriaceae bacterium Y2011]|uniref:carbohydrate ABC transporter permease n=1 Tax=Microlunatus sp. Y2014 TaxID=3418488 RepID=UPI003B4F7228
MALNELQGPPIAEAQETADQAPPRRERGGRPRRPIRNALMYVLLTVVGLLFVGPFLVMLSIAFKPAHQSIDSFPPDLIPRPPVLDYFVEATTTIPFFTFTGNSVIYIVVIIPLYLLVSAMTAYPLARINFPGRGLFFMVFLSTMFLPGELMLIPRFLVMSQLSLVDTYMAVILPAILSALGIFMLRQTFASMPEEIFEAARVDGASEWGIFVRIAMPAAVPTLAVLTILGFINVWNSFVWPLVVLNDQSKFPLALGIAYLSGVSGQDVRGLAAGTVLSLIPVIVVFLALQRHILGSMSGALKG